MPDFAGQALPMTASGAAAFADTTGSGIPEMWSVLAVETSGCGFLPDTRPKILFERHKFSALTGGRFDHSHPDISQPSPGGYGMGGANQYNRLAQAVALDRANALKSASWGIGQIMGLNFAQAGFADVESMVAAMMDSEDAQLAAMAQFLSATHLCNPLALRDWTAFALGYNGADFARNNYDGLLRHFFSLYAAGPLPDVAVRTAQLLLNYKGFDPKGVDGLLGPGTRTAILLFQSENDLAGTGVVDDTLLQALSM